MQIETQPPDILDATPKPRSLIKQFHRRQIQVWEGEVGLGQIHGWIDNKRSNVLIRNWQRQYGRDPNDDELFQLVLADEGHGREDAGHRIQALARNIYQNGVRVPLILAADGRLLDGNRRYYACRLLAQTAKGHEKQQFERIPVWVLSSKDPADEENVITERNLVSDQKVEWPYYVKALQVFEDRNDNGLTVKDIAGKYDWEPSRVRAAIQAVELSQEFAAYHDEDTRAYEIAYRNLIWFDQLRRSHSKLLDQDAEFKEAVFDMMFEEPAKFKQARDFLKLGEIRANPDAWAKLRGVAGPGGLQAAQDQVAADRALAGKSPAGKLTQAIKILEEIVTNTDVRLIDPDELAKFHELARRMPAGPTDPEWQFEKMLQWLNEMTVEQVGSLSANALDRLQSTLQRVDAMSRSVEGSGSA